MSWICSEPYCSYWRCPNNMPRRVYVTTGCPSVRLSARPSVPSIDSSSDVRRVCGREISIDRRRRRSAANASCWPTVDAGSAAQKCVGSIDLYERTTQRTASQFSPNVHSVSSLALLVPYARWPIACVRRVTWHNDVIVSRSCRGAIIACDRRKIDAVGPTLIIHWL